MRVKTIFGAVALFSAGGLTSALLLDPIGHQKALESSQAEYWKQDQEIWRLRSVMTEYQERERQPHPLTVAQQAALEAQERAVQAQERMATALENTESAQDRMAESLESSEIDQQIAQQRLERLIRANQ